LENECRWVTDSNGAINDDDDDDDDDDNNNNNNNDRNTLRVTTV
jgi:hypothetical protein